MKNRLRFGIVTAALASPILGAVGASAITPTVDGITVGEDGVLTLTKDVSACLEISEGDNFALDLAGYTLTAANATCGPIHVNGGTLSIYGNGTVQNTADSVNPLINNEVGTLNIQNGNFISWNATSGRYTPVINTDKGNTIISGGNFTQKGGYNVVTGNGNGSTEIIGGVFTNEVADWSGTIGNLENANAYMQITGGTFNPGSSSKWAVVNFEGNRMTISGGTFNGTVGQYDAENPFISGGTFAGNPEEATYWDGSKFVNVNAVISSKMAVQGEDTKWTVTDKPVALSAITATPDAVTLAIGGEDSIKVTYNEGFLTKEIKTTSITHKSGDEVGSVYFAAGDQTSSLVGVWGFIPGEGVYTISVTDNQGNTVTKDITVTVEEALKQGGDVIEDEHGNVEIFAQASFAEPVEGASAIQIKSGEMTDGLKALDGNLKFILDISAVDGNGDKVEVLNNEVTITIMVKKDVLGDNFDNFQIVYIKDGVIAEYFDVTNKEYDEGLDAYYITFKTTHLSDYGVLASNEEFVSADERNAALAATASTPDTGKYTGAKSAGVVGVIATSVMVGVVTSFATARKMRRINRKRVQLSQHK